MIEASVGLSREWDARSAGREVAKNTLEGLSSDPSFLILFSTIHYEKYGGMNEFLEGVWDILPEKTPVIGGSVAGFLNNYGSFTRGASAMAVYCSDMDVALGVGNNTKRNPLSAAEKSTQMVKNGLQKSYFKNKFLFNIVSGPLLLKIPGQGDRKIVDSGIMSSFVMLSFGMSQYLLQKGLGREDEVFEQIVNDLPDYKMLLGTAVDDYKGVSNYQFFNDKLLTNSVVNIGISTDLDFDVCTTHGMKKSDIQFNITKLSKDRHIIRKINNKPAVQELYRLLNWPEGFLNDAAMLNKILYYPISLRRDDREVPAVMLFILKDSILTPCIIDGGDVHILTVSGRDMIKSIEDNLNYFKSIKPEFGLSSICLTILQTLGYRTEIIQKRMNEYFGNKPFLAFWCAGEGTYSPSRNLIYANMSVNSSVFGNFR